MSEYLTMLWDINRSRAVYVNRDQQVAFTAKKGQQIRVPHAPNMLSTMVYMDKPSTVPVEPIQVGGQRLYSLSDLEH